MSGYRMVAGANTLKAAVGTRPVLNRAALAPLAIVFFGGANLILVQWVLVRELTTLLLGTELVTLLVSVSYFAGLSVGYRLAGRIRRTWLVPLAVLTLALHLSLPIWFRLSVAMMDFLDLYPVAYLILPLLTPFLVSAFYSVFLPLFADSGEGGLPRLYAAELLGSACGILLLVALGGAGMPLIFLLYSAGLLLILYALGVSPRRIGLLAVGCALWLVILPGTDAWSNALWYHEIHDLPTGTVTLYTGYSAYQKVDVLEGRDGERYLYLDGLQHFGGTDGSRLNVILGRIPASLTLPDNALVIGAGSMEMEWMIAGYAGHVTTVEIDPMVVEVSLRFFDGYNHMSELTNHSIVIDDAKHYLANTQERYDLVATDTPAAFNIQTATLYSVPFYEQVAEHLNPGGVLSANLTSTFLPGDTVSRRVAASLLEAFDEVMVVTSSSAGWSFAYASDDLPFDRDTLADILHTSGETQFAIFDTPAVRAIVGDAQPITLDTMNLVLEISADWITDRWE